MRRFRYPFDRPAQLHRDIDAELEAHLAFAAAALERDGLSPEQAREAAQARLGDRETLHRRLYQIDHRSVTWSVAVTTVREFVTDVRFAFRRLRHRPLLTMVTIFTLAIGIGTALTFVGAADAILLRPLPFVEPDRVVTLWRSPVDDVEQRAGLAPGTIVDLQRDSRTFSAIAGARPYSMDIMRNGESLSVGTWMVTDGFFAIQHAAPALGRLLEPRDFTPGAVAAVVVSHTFWRTYLGGDSSAIGRIENLDGVPYEIRGVLPPDFPYAEGRQLYVATRVEGARREDRTSDNWNAYGRLRQGIDPAIAATELRLLAQRSDALAGARAAPRSLHVTTMRDSLLGDVSVGLGLLAFGALLVLLMSATNASGVLLADTMARARELAIRAAVGAGQQRIRRQLLTESAVLVCAATTVGVALGASGLRAFATWAPAELPRLATLQLDARMIALALVLSLFVISTVSLATARVANSVSLGDAMRSASGAVSLRGRRMRSALIVTQMATAVLLLCGGGLLLRSWMQLTMADQGYRAEGVSAIANHVWGTFRTAESRATFVQTLEPRLLTVPGVTHAAVASALPLAPAIGDSDAEVSLPERATPFSLSGIVASPSYFSALDIATVRGRTFAETDHAKAELVAVLSSRAAANLFPQGDAIDQYVDVRAPSAPPRRRRIIGIVADVRYAAPEAEGGPVIYLPHAQAPTGSLYVITRQRSAPSTVLPAVKQVIREFFPRGSMNEVVLLSDAKRSATVPRRFALLLLTTFAALSLLLTTIGLSGLLTQWVQSRARELGIRLALGASPKRLRFTVLREGVRLSLIGTVIGLAIFLLGAGVLQSFLYGIPARDPLTLASVASLMLAVAGCSCWWPALLAARVDPLRLLRAD